MRGGRPREETDQNNKGTCHKKTKADIRTHGTGKPRKR